jgi:hypothetical protein
MRRLPKDPTEAMVWKNNLILKTLLPEEVI